jgi:Zn-dependent M16 (insulinase) family peptidase
MTRMNAYFSAHGAAREYLGGTEMTRWMKRRSSAGEAELAALLEQLKSLAGRIFTARRLTLSISDNCPASLLGALCAAFPRGEEQPPREMAYAPLGIRQEGIVIPAAVGYACRGSRLTRCGLGYHGSLPILANVLNFAYLWSEIRVQGGAYGCGFQADRYGNLFSYSYRDPAPDKTLSVDRDAAAFLKQFLREGESMDKYIISTLNDLNPLISPREQGALADLRWLSGYTREQAERVRKEILHADEKDLLAVCGLLEAFAERGAVCVVAPGAALDRCPDLAVEDL